MMRVPWVRVALVCVLVLAAEYVANGREPLRVPLRHPLETFPLVVQGWRGFDGAPLDAETLRVLGADAYLNRTYQNDSGVVGLFIGYYEAQRPGNAIHSPKNCLPGNGWQPVQQGTMDIDAEGVRVPANRVVVERRGDKQLVLYWFQGRGRLLASEYANTLALLADGWRLHRTNGALVRIVTPLDGAGHQGEMAAVDFARAALPALMERIP
jgi:EpsI family protein